MDGFHGIHPSLLLLLGPVRGVQYSFLYIFPHKQKKRQRAAFALRAIIAAGELRFRVRHGNGHVLPAIAAASYHTHGPREPRELQFIYIQPDPSGAQHAARLHMRTTSVSGHWSATAVHLAVPAPGVHLPGVLSRALHGTCPTED